MTLLQTARAWARQSAISLRRLSLAVFTVLIRGYQLLLSPMLGPRCRFYPSCSDYALQAVTRRGWLAGIGLAIWRVLRCQPWGSGGIDEVPGDTRPLSRGRWPEALRESEASEL